MMSTITQPKKTLAYLIFSLLSFFLSFSQIVPPTTSCSSKDLELVAAQITGGDACNNCIEGAQLTKTLTLSIRNTTGSDRGAFAFWGDLEIYSGVDGSLISSITKTGCTGPIIGGGVFSLDFGTVTYNCGDILKFTNLWGAWTTPSVSCPIAPNNISPKCDKWGTVPVNAGVNGTFVTVDSIWSGASGSIDLTPTGGSAPYTYLWTTTDGQIPSGQQNSQDLTNLKPGTYTVKITDANGCSATKSRTIEPVYPALAAFPAVTDITVPCGGATTSSLTYTNGLIAPFLISGSVTSTLSSQNPAGPCGGDITESWTYTDALNRTIAASRIIHVLPAAVPSMTAPADITVSCGAAVPAPSTINFSNGLAGGCLISGASNPSTFNVTVAGNCNGKVTETWTATDICGRTIASVSRIITIQDNTPPIITCPASVSATTNTGCTATNIVLGTPVTSDNCGVISVVSDHPSSTYSIGTTTVNWTVTDSCGNTASCAQTVTVTDNQNPIITVCAAPVNVNTDNGACTASNVNLGAPTVTDNCSLAQVTVSNNAPSVFPIGTTTVTWTVKDGANNTTTCTQIVTVTDNQTPMITACAAPVSVNADSGACTASNVTLGTPTVTDNCSMGQVIVSNNAPSAFPIGITTVIWTIKDAANNTTTCTQTVTVTDNQKPIITACAVPVNVNTDNGTCSASNVNLGAPTVTDNCSLAQVSVTNNAPAIFPVGTTTVTWTIKDAANNTITCLQTVTVTDNQKPIVPVLANVTGQCSASVPVPIASDNCAGIITATTSDPLIYNNQGTYIVHWSFNDGNGNITNVNQNVIVNNTVPPSAPVLIDVIGQCSATVSIPTVVNSCDYTTIYGTTPDPVSYTEQGTYVVHWTFDDGNGNIITANQNIIINDTTAPTTPTLANVTGECSASATVPTTIDTCAGTITGTTSDPLTYNTQGTHVIHWTFNDGNGNSTAANQNVIVADTKKPTVIACAGSVNVTADKDACTASNVNLGAPNVSDNCTLNPVTVTNNAPSIFPIGTTSVTWTIKDIANNITTCTQTVTVTDNQIPTVVACAAAVNVTADNGACTASNVNLGAPTVTDNCNSTPLAISNDAPSIFPIGTTTVTWTIKDAANNTVTCTQTVTVTDNQKPIITACAAPVSVAADNGACTASNVIIGAPTLADNCDLTQLTVTNNAPSVFPIGTTTITWTVKDAANNIVTCMQTVTVTDNQQPIITACAAPVSVNADSGICTASNVNLGAPTVTDNCSLAQVTVTNNAPSVFPIGTTNVTWTIKDAANNTVTCTQTVTVTDRQNPIVTVCAAPVNVIANLGVCTASNVNLGTPSVTDNCSLAGLTVTNNAPSVFPIGTTTVTWTVKDAANNFTTCTQTVTVTDDQKPIITACATPVSVNADNGTCTASNVSLGAPSLADNCDLTQLTVTNNAPSAFPIGITTVTWTITDAAGNIAICTQMVTVNDNQMPTVTSCAAPMSVTADKDACSATNVDLGTPPIVTDNCSLAQLTVTNNAPSTFPIGTTIVTWMVKDAAGNTTTCTQTVTVTDDQKPITPVILDVSGQCSATVSTPTTSDNCAGTITATTPDPLVYNEQGTYIVHWTFNDGNGNITTVNQNVIVDNTVPPSPPILTDVIGQCSATVPTPTVVNSCTNATIYGATTDPLSYTNQGTYTVHWTFDDGNGNIITSNQKVIVADTEKPTIVTCAPTVSVTADSGLCSASNVSLIAPTTSDNCTLNPVTVTNDAPTVFPIGTTTVTWTIKDIAGNISNCEQTVTVTDNQIPIVTACAEPVSVTADKDACSASNVNLSTPPTFTDNCSISEVTITNDAPATFPIGMTTVTWTIKDAAGNIATCTQTVTVIDSQKPNIIVCAADVSVNADTDACSATNVNLGTPPTFTDNCSLTEVTVTNDAPSLFPIGTTTITWTIKDAAGNTATCTQTVTVIDDQKPVVVACAATVVVTADNDACTASNVNLGNPPTFTDNCNLSEITITNDAPTTFPIGTSTVTWTIKDAAGNTAICTQEVTVTDDQKPTVLACATPVSVAADNGVCTASNVNLGNPPTFTDNCSLTQVTLSNDAPSVFPLGITTITWIIKDAAGNTTTCTQLVTVIDDQKPIIAIALADVIGQCSATVPVPTASDNCSGTITATTQDPLVYNEQGTFIVHWSFDDGNGNILVANQNVIVDNTIPPAAPVLADVTGECSATASVPTVVNNCYSTVINGTTNDPLTYTEQGTHIIHWTFDDGNGNIITANQNVIIHDVTAPVFVVNEAPADVTVECSAVPSASAADFTATDNCDINPVITYNEVKTDETCAGSYTLTRTWTATDASGNSSSVSQKITVQDVTAPVFTSVLPGEISASCDEIPTAEVMTATDNCGDATVSFTETKTDGFCAGDYTLTRTWTATDSCGNNTSLVQTVNISDIVPPAIKGVFQNITTVDCDRIPPIPQLEFLDDCSGVGEIIAPSSDDNIINKTADSYTIIRTWKVSDLCGNESTFVQTVNVMIKDAISTASFDACNADSATFDLNTLIPQEYAGLGIWKDISSSGALKGDNDGIFSPFGIPAGQYTVEYDIEDPICPRKVQITATLDTDCFPLGCETLYVHNFFSPNGDGYNDVFTIDNIDQFICYQTNRVRIYNRWGALLFETEGYDNNEKAFRGISYAGATVNQSAELPSGTYYYLLEYTSDNKNYKQGGYLYLSR